MASAPPIDADSAATEVDETESQPKEDLSLLIDRTPPWARWPASTFALAVVIGLVYWFFSNTPLLEIDLWAHAAYGRWTVENRAVPVTEPLMPLCEGMPMPAVDWLWDVAAFQMADRLGPQGLKFLIAGPIATAIIFMTVMMFRRTRSALWTVVGLAAMLAALWMQLFIRPQLAGLMLFCAVFCVAREMRGVGSYVATGLLFALWSNVHGSWPVGIALLGALAVGRGLDVWRRTGVLTRAFADQTARRLVLLTELAAAAVLLNPHGWTIYHGVWAITQDVNVQRLIEWEPLTLTMRQGKALFAVLAVLVLLYRVSPRRVSLQEPLLLITLTAATFHTSRFIVWLAPVAAYYVAVHGAAAWRLWRRQTVTVPEGKGLWFAASLGVIWIFFAITPQYQALTGSNSPTFDDLVELRDDNVLAKTTPVGAIEHLREQPVDGLTYNSLRFGDSLLWFAPDVCTPFIHSHAHLTPVDVWEDYFRIRDGDKTLERLDRYGVVAAVVETRRASLVRAIRTSDHWEMTYQDAVATVLRRTSPVGAGVSAGRDTAAGPSP